MENELFCKTGDGEVIFGKTACGAFSIEFPGLTQLEKSAIRKIIEASAGHLKNHLHLCFHTKNTYKTYPQMYAANDIKSSTIKSLINKGVIKSMTNAYSNGCAIFFYFNPKCSYKEFSDKLKKFKR